ncbi:MAG TPA: class I SAM-dependent methyltransferase [Myxococcales bacterium]|nr:class I SAM-dependent methyltransferase [Myxococcales bacterium]
MNLRERVGKAALGRLTEAVGWSLERLPASLRPPADRTLFFEGKKNRRYWWHWSPRHRYVPAVYDVLSEGEWALLQEWFADTERRELIGEASVPFMSVLQGFVVGSAIAPIVQCGHYAGYSTLVLGFMLRKMKRQRALFTIDIDGAMCDYTRDWVARAGLEEVVTVVRGDSADPEMPGRARAAFGTDISSVLIDSSHQYEHTLRELDLWYGALRPGGLLFLHDVSDFAASFDSTGKGGVSRALKEWTARTQAPCLAVNAAAGPQEELTYKDGCGLGIVQKPRPVSEAR